MHLLDLPRRAQSAPAASVPGRRSSSDPARICRPNSATYTTPPAAVSNSCAHSYGKSGNGACVRSCNEQHQRAPGTRRASRHTRGGAADGLLPSRAGSGEASRARCYPPPPEGKRLRRLQLFVELLPFWPPILPAAARCAQGHGLRFATGTRLTKCPLRSQARGDHFAPGPCTSLGSRRPKSSLPERQKIGRPRQGRPHLWKVAT